MSERLGATVATSSRSDRLPERSLSPESGAGLCLRAMTASDLDEVMAIEQRIYPFPWTRGNFADSIASGYDMPVLEIAGRIAAYAAVMRGPDEVHLLNLSVDQTYQGRGLGRRLLEQLLRNAQLRGALGMLLEVRPSNTLASRLYRSMNFETIGVRRRYYPSWGGSREDAIVMRRSLCP